MKTSNWTDEALIAAIMGRENDRDRALEYVFRQRAWQNLLEAFVAQNSGTADEAHDLFKETLIIFDRNIRSERFEGRSALKTYFFAIAKRLWWKILSRRQPVEQWTAQQHDEADKGVEDYVMQEEKIQLLQKGLSQIGDRCKAILEYYQLDYSMEEIAAAVGLSSAAMAKKEAYRCRIRLREYLLNNPDWKNFQN